MSTIKAVVFDMDGVLRIGSKLIKNTENTLVNLEKKGFKTMIVTNECRFTVEELKEDLEELGLKIPENCKFYTAALAVRDYIENKITRFKKNIIVGVVGELGLYQTIHTLTKYENITLLNLIDKNKKYEEDLYLIIGAVNKIKIKDLNKILNWVEAGAKIITTCPDTTDPSSKGDFNLGMPNHMLHMAGYNIKTSSYSTGKPHPIHKDKIMETLKLKSTQEILFVGDTLCTDIRLAEESNFKSCLVLSGNTRKDALKNYVTEPDHILNDITELNSILEF